MTLSSTQRGYGTAHRAKRAALAPVVARGEGWCAEVVCLKRTRWIDPQDPAGWHLAHGSTRDTYRGPAHALCNTSEAGRRARANDRRRQATAGAPSRRRRVL